MFIKWLKLQIVCYLPVVYSWWLLIFYIGTYSILYKLPIQKFNNHWQQFKNLQNSEVNLQVSTQGQYLRSHPLPRFSNVRIIYRL